MDDHTRSEGRPAGAESYPKAKIPASGVYSCDFSVQHILSLGGIETVAGDYESVNATLLKGTGEVFCKQPAKVGVAIIVAGKRVGSEVMENNLGLALSV